MSKVDLHVKLAGGQQVVGGYSLKVSVVGNSNGINYTVNPLTGNYQFVFNNGAWTLTAPTVDCAVDIMVQNQSGAGAVTFSGFTVGSTGDPLTITNGHVFIISVRRMAGISTYTIKALQ